MPSADAEALLQGAEDVLPDEDEDFEPEDDLEVPSIISGNCNDMKMLKPTLVVGTRPCSGRTRAVDEGLRCSPHCASSPLFKNPSFPALSIALD